MSNVFLLEGVLGAYLSKGCVQFGRGNVKGSIGIGVGAVAAPQGFTKQHIARYSDKGGAHFHNVLVKSIFSK